MEKQFEKARKKFAKPPVKNACLACRASRTRCDGKEVCTTCLTKGKECRYTSSKRGGPRFSKRGESRSKTPGESVTVYDDEFFQHASTFGAPGAGLRNLDSPMNFDFEANMLWDIDNLALSTTGITPNFSNENFEQYNTSTESPSDTSCIEDRPPVSLRSYASDDAILDAYYIYIHAYFPILPPPLRGAAVDRPLTDKDAAFPAFHPSSPLSLAILAILSLIPCADDQQPKSSLSVKRRREQAQKYAQNAMECIEAESDLPDSLSSPSLALQNSEPILHRRPFHPNTPVQLESILALLLLSNYEYTQRGNLTKMRSRAGQAMLYAMDMELYKKKELTDRYAEARSRAWWMTYISVCQGSITSNTRPTLSVYDPRFTIEYPTTSSDSEAWGLLIKAEQVILEATQFVIDLKECLEGGKDISNTYAKMQQLEYEICPLVSAAESQPIQSASPMSMYPSEDMVAKALRGIARIKLNSARIKVHRHCAFQDMPIFSQRHCDLKSTSQPETRSSPQNPNMSCCQDSLRDLVSRGPNDVPQAQPQVFQNTSSKSPFTTNFSANICRISALSIANSFSNLPLPNPSGSIDLPSAYLIPCPTPKPTTSHPSVSTPTSQNISNLIPAPRTMPSFACCAMQSSYAMLMLCYKAHAIPLPDVRPESAFEFSAAGSGIELVMRSYVDQLTQGLKSVLGALENYSIAFEAVDGMRDQVGEALIAAVASFEGDGMDGNGMDGVQGVDWQGNGGRNGVGDGLINGMGAGGWS